MNQIRFYFRRLCPVLCVAAMLVSCRNSSAKANESAQSVGKIDSTLVVKPDTQDLLNLLQGSWQSVSDSSYHIEVSGALFRHFYNGNLQRESQVDIDAGCAGVACSGLNGEQSGWCLVARGEDGGMQCFLILKCDETALEMSAVGSANPSLRFRKF